MGSVEATGHGTTRLIGLPDQAWTDEASSAFAQAFFTAAEAAGLATTPAPFDEDLIVFGRAGQEAVADLQGEVRRGPGALEVLLAICVFVGAEGASWTVSRICDGVWTPLREQLARLLRSRSAAVSEGTQPVHRVMLRTVVGPVQSVVEVTLEVGSDTQAEALAAAAVRLQHEALTRLSHHTREGTLIRYGVAGDGTDLQQPDAALTDGAQAQTP